MRHKGTHNKKGRESAEQEFHGVTLSVSQNTDGKKYAALPLCVPVCFLAIAYQAAASWRGR
jgi:hypothetical protein